MHPMLKPALRRGWRDRQTVQFGVAPAHAVVLGPVDTATGSFLDLIDGTRGLPLLHREGRAMGLSAERIDGLLERLAGAGLIDDPTRAGSRDRVGGTPVNSGFMSGDGSGSPPGAGLGGGQESFDRLRPDLASLSVVHPEPDGGWARLAARRATRVQVRGAGRVGAAVAALLSAAGVGQVDVLDGGCVEAWDVSPAGVPADRIGERRDAAARRAVRSAAPGRRWSREARAVGAAAPAGLAPSEAAVPTGIAPSRAAAPAGLALVVIAPRDGLAAYAPDLASAEPLLAAGTPHLFAGVIEATGVVGPLVLPGGTACARCVELARTEIEPAWPRMLAQWRSGRGAGRGRGTAGLACDVALATMVAGITAAYALSFLDGDRAPCANARWEFALPDLSWVQRPLGPHRDCGCGAAGSSEPESASVTGARRGTMAG
ncbi:ThiF family adenylyltransferase [Streptomyces sp. H27-D2]|uniref:ThiF family adenylyltransferase n=1 Tax=Streptomyces sp. H27-D2 TaxID=3046304 RepID=UPI002DBEF6BE|nr:ThiF family adenylyltransferase [Streptomyces sp. H27-D2]MEC4018335.1 ThiF family adenylyltransferase [Streptomyces sp. H27-D2]